MTQTGDMKRHLRRLAQDVDVTIQQLRECRRRMGQVQRADASKIDLTAIVEEAGKLVRASRSLNESGRIFLIVCKDSDPAAPGAVQGEPMDLPREDF